MLFFFSPRVSSNILNKESMIRPLSGINRLCIVNTLHIQFYNLSLNTTSLGFVIKTKTGKLTDQYTVFKPERRAQQ